MPSDKQVVYQEILEIILPYARNVQLWPFYKKVFRSNIYPELELVHNLPSLIMYEGFTKGDIYWLNTQACNYMLACQRGEGVFCEIMYIKFKKLVNIAPECLKFMIDRSPINCLI